MRRRALTLRLRRCRSTLLAASFVLVFGVAGAALATAPDVSTSAASSVTATGGTLNGSANPGGEATTGWFRYSANDPGSCNDTFGTRAPASSASDTVLGSGSSPVDYSQGISGLAPGTTYYYCAIAANPSATSFGSVQSFTTAAAPPGVTTSTPTLVTGAGAQLNGTANPGGDATTGWFRYSTVSPGTCNDTFGTRAPTSGGSDLGAGSAPVGYSQGIVGLSPGTTYFVCAIAANSIGTSFGSLLSFTTDAAPAVTTAAATSVTATGATLDGSADPNGDSTTGWYRYGTSDPGTCNDSFGSRAPLTGGTNLGAGTAPVSYARVISGLSPGMTYYFCAVAANSVGTAFGAVQSFTTPAAPDVTTSAATLVTVSGATLNGAADPNGASTTGWFRYSTSDPGSCNDTFGTRAPSSSASDTPLGSGSSPVDYSRAISGLTPGTTYYFCAIAANSVGTSFGSVQSFTTAAAAPSVTTSAPTLVTGTSAQLNGAANPNGASSTGWFRYSTVSPGTCNDSFGTRAPSSGGDQPRLRQLQHTVLRVDHGALARHHLFRLRDRGELGRHLVRLPALVHDGFRAGGDHRRGDVGNRHRRDPGRGREPGPRLHDGLVPLQHE